MFHEPNPRPEETLMPDVTTLSSAERRTLVLISGAAVLPDNVDERDVSDVSPDPEAIESLRAKGLVRVDDTSSGQVIVPVGYGVAILDAMRNEHRAGTPIPDSDGRIPTDK